LANSKYNEEASMEQNSINTNVNTKAQDKIRKLEKERDEKEEEIKRLEKEYLEKIAKLLIMTQIHCEIKTDIYNKFDTMGITSHLEEVKQDGGDQSFSQYH
jgi:hypothetical protein